MEKNLVSTHRLVSDYGAKGKLKAIIVGWAIFLVILGVTKVPAVQDALIHFSKSVTVGWVTSTVNFLIHGFWFIAIPLIIGTFVTISKKQTFDELRIYDTGVGFTDSKSGVERFAAYPDVRLSYGSMRESLQVESKTASIKRSEYGWREFTQPDVLRNNLERYGKWGV